ASRRTTRPTVTTGSSSRSGAYRFHISRQPGPEFLHLALEQHRPRPFDDVPDLRDDRSRVLRPPPVQEESPERDQVLGDEPVALPGTDGAPPLRLGFLVPLLSSSDRPLCGPPLSIHQLIRRVKVLTHPI